MSVIEIEYGKSSARVRSVGSTQDVDSPVRTLSVRRPLLLLGGLVFSAIAFAVGGLTLGITLAGTGWAAISSLVPSPNEDGSTPTGLDGVQTAGVGLFILGLVGSAVSVGLALIYAGLLRAQLPRAISLLTALGLCVGCLVGAVLGGGELTQASSSVGIGGLSPFWSIARPTDPNAFQGVDQLSFFMGSLIFVLYAPLGICAGVVFLGLALRCDGEKAARMRPGALNQHSALHGQSARQKEEEARVGEGLHEAIPGVKRPSPPTPSESLRKNRWGALSYLIILSLAMLASALFPALWNSAFSIPAFWQSPIPDTTWVVNGASAAWSFPPPRPESQGNSSSSDDDNGSYSEGGLSDAYPSLWNGTIYVKLYVDAAVYYGFMLLVGLISIGVTYSAPLRRIFHARICTGARSTPGGKRGAVFPFCCLAPAAHLADWTEFPNGIAFGEALLLAAFAALYGWWFWWWGTGFNYLRANASSDPNPNLQVYARVLGHMTTLTMSFLVYPVAKNSVWESVFGIPFERAIKYHRMLGRLCWLLVTAHMLVWQSKWLKEGTLWSNALQSQGLQIYPGPGGTHSNNFTIVIAEAAWLMLTVILSLAVAVRRWNWELFKYAHYGVWLFMAVALFHAWCHWYYMIGGLILYAYDKLVGVVRAARSVRVLHAVHAAGITRLEIDASALGSQSPTAGQYVFLCIPALSPLQWHPYTISSPPNSMCGGRRVLTFHIKSMGPKTWSEALGILVSSPGFDPASLVVSVDGPYGRAGHYYESETVILVAGGIGVTPALAILGDLYAKRNDPDQVVREVHLIWSSRSKKLIQAMAPELASILLNSGSVGGDETSFSLRLHHTHTNHHKKAHKGGGSKMTDSLLGDSVFPEEDADQGLVDPVAAGMSSMADVEVLTHSYHSGRPNLGAIFTEISRACTEKEWKATVFVCGPRDLKQNVSLLAEEHAFDFHSETFLL